MSKTPDLTDHKMAVINIELPDGMTAAEYVARVKLRSMKTAKAPRNKKILNYARLLAEATKINGGPIQLKAGPAKPEPTVVARLANFQH